MGNCQYCGKPAGFLRSKHPECEEKQRKRERVIQDGQQLIVAEILRAVTKSDKFEDLEKTILEIEQSSFVPSSERKSLLVKGWENAVQKFLEDGILDAFEEDRLAKFQKHFALSEIELNVNGALSKTVKAATLRDVLDGIIPQRMTDNINLSINFQKGEQLVWSFPGSEYFEDKTRRQFVGGSQGMSLRVMKGVYYRVGAFKGHAVESTERIHVDTGLVVITNKNIYFVGSRKSVRIPFEKIVSFEPFSNGIGVMRDAATAKPQILVTGDGWFTYNLVTNLAQLGTSDISKKKTVSFEEAGLKSLLVAIGENQENINYFLEKTLPQIASHLNINLNDDYMDEFRGSAYIFCLWATTKAMEPEGKRMLDICRRHYFQDNDDFHKILSTAYEEYNNIWDESAGENQQKLAKSMLFGMFFPDVADKSVEPDERVNNISAMSLINTFIFNVIARVRKAKADIGLK